MVQLYIHSIAVLAAGVFHWHRVNILIIFLDKVIALVTGLTALNILKT